MSLLALMLIFQLSEPPRMEATPVSRLRNLHAAIGAYDLGDYKKCEELAMMVQGVFPSDTMAMTLAGAAMVKRGNLAGAIEVFTRYTQFHPLEATGHFYLGICQHLSNDKASAIKSYWTALLLDPGLDGARTNLGQLN